MFSSRAEVTFVIDVFAVCTGFPEDRIREIELVSGFLRRWVIAVGSSAFCWGI